MNHKCFRVSQQGIGEIYALLDKQNYEILKKELKNEDVTKQFPKTATVILHTPQKIIPGPGFIHAVTAPVARAGISIELLTFAWDTIFLVNEKDAAHVFEILKGYVDWCRNLQF